MNLRCRLEWILATAAMVLGAACGGKPAAPKATESPKPVEYFHTDRATAGTVTGRITFHGVKPKPKRINMDSDPGCPPAGTRDLVVTGKSGGLANAFVYIETGLEGKRFEAPAQSVELDQHGCMYTPHVLGLMTGQTLDVKNGDPVSHNIHPMPKNNREWSSQQSTGAHDIEHKFPRAEVMIPIKCNVHSWMRAYIGVLDHPYFAVTGADGNFEFPNVPPGDYTIAAWHETLGEARQKAHLDASGKVSVNLSYP